MFIVNRLLFFCIYCFVQCQLRHRTISRQVAGSIPNGVIGIFHWRNPSGCTMATGASHPLTAMSTRDISWGRQGKSGRCVGWTDFMSWLFWNLEASVSWNPQGLSRPVQGFLYLYNASCSVGLCAVSRLIQTCVQIAYNVLYPHLLGISKSIKPCRWVNWQLDCDTTCKGNRQYVSRNTVAHSLTTVSMESQQCITFLLLRYICRQHCNKYRKRCHSNTTMRCNSRCTRYGAANSIKRTQVFM